MSGFHPRRVTTVQVEQLGDELCIYDWKRHQVHTLNATATALWRHCDGETTIPEMVDRLGEEWNTANSEPLVELGISQLTAARLLQGGVTRRAERSGLSRRDLIRRLGPAAVLIPVITSITAPTPLEAQSAGSRTFEYNGAPQTFSVPFGLTHVTVAAYGAGGGSSILGGGKGGLITATIAVAPSEVLGIYVGGKGPDAVGYFIEPVAGGFNGGGGSSGCGAGGGGASDVRRGSTKLVVGGGGGGTATGGGGRGGDAGGTTGTDGAPGYMSAGGGGGATQLAGGAGG